MLPTAVLAQATTFDLYVADIATKYHNRQQEIQEGKIKDTKLTNEQMKAMIAKVRSQNNDSQSN